MVKTVMKKKTVLIALMLVALLLPSCSSLKTSEKGGEDFSSEDEIIDEDFGVDNDITNEVEWCEITFDSAGGTAVASQTVGYGEKIEKPSNPTKQNDSRYEYSFDGWYLGDYAWNFEADTVSEDITLTAKWKIESEFTNPFLPSD